MRAGVPVAFAVVAVLAAFAAGLGCATKSKLVAQGGECGQATDCADGLVCIPQNSGSSICSSDLSPVQTPPEVPDASRPDTGSGEGGGEDGGSEGAVTSDVAAPDAAAQPDVTSPVDAAPPVDASLPQDAASPPQDAAIE